MEWKPVQKREIEYFQCGVCSQVCANFDEYSFHVNNSHEELLKPDINLSGIESLGVDSLVPQTTADTNKKSTPMSWPCDVCPSVFKFESYLKRHRLRHFEPEIQCIECNERFHDEYTLNHHLAVVHEKQTAWKCDLCKKVFKFEALLKRHRLRHFEPTVKCTHCDKKFYDEYLVKQHRDFVHNNTRNFVCDICNYATGNKSTLQRHMIRIHTKNFPYPCDLCGKGYTDKYMLDAHRQSVHEGVEHTCEDCGKSFKYAHGLQEHKKLHESSPKKREEVMCDLCGDKFKYLKEHVMKMHGGVKTIICEVCGKRFYTKNLLNIHIMRKHKNERPFKCSFCFHGLVTKNELKEHIKRRHSNNDSLEDIKEKPFQCSICGKRFKASTSLTDHMRKHSGEKAYTCNACQEKFISKHYLKSHRCGGITDQLLEMSSK